VNTQDQLLELLADGEVHSGEALARALGVSRAAVWKHLQQLGALGLEITARHGQGYRLSSPLELLDAELIREQLGEALCRQIAAIEVQRSIDSTNRYLMEAPADAPATPGRLCLAEHQSAGRGRRGRRWQSPFGASVYLSLRWRFGETPSQLPALALAAGVAVADVLEAAGVEAVGLKWPNDIYWRGRKLGGILLEMRGEAGGASEVVIGLGLNVSMPPGVAREIDQPWVDLAEVLGSKRPARPALAAALARALCQAVLRFTAEGFEAFMADYERRDVLAGHEVRLEQGGKILQGKALGIDTDGALKIRINGEVRRYVSGDVSLRRVP